jgi:MoxR-like ATPase
MAKRSATRSQAGYRPLFDPARGVADAADEAVPEGVGDRRDGRVYVYTPEIELAVNVALATGRPLLVRGPSGGGKSTLARHAARVLGWRYYERVISSRTQAHDVLWEIDHVRRLQDAHGGKLKPELADYVRPGVLWWVFDRAGARRQAARFEGRPAADVVDPNQGAEHARAVVLLDEIDKADPDVPNNLLVPFGSLEFRVDDTDLAAKTTTKRAPLIFLTTNDERELPAAFLRRCVELELRAPDAARLAAIGREHFPDVPADRLERIAQLIVQVVPTDAQGNAMPSPAEYLDTVRASAVLRVPPQADGAATADSKRPTWDELTRITIWKHGRQPG